jgi:predicted DNA binding CopG/RHH family protein
VNCENNKYQSLDDLLKEEHFEKVKDKYTLVEFYERLPE